MRRMSAVRMLTACAVCLTSGLAVRGQRVELPYVLLLRSRDGVVTPERTKDGQTGGGFIQVTQIQPNVVMALMRGAVAAGTGHHEGAASMQFNLTQDFEVVATRGGVRPPRLVVAGWLIGHLDSTLKEGGTAEQGPACADIQSAGQPLVTINLKPHGVGGGENLLVNDRAGPFEQVVAPGSYCLHQSFALRANQGKSYCHHGAAAAAFDPDPKLDSTWNDVLKPFRAVPHRDFGFRVLIRVVEDPPPPEEAAPPPPPPPDELPPPKEEKVKNAPLVEDKAPR